MPLPSFDRLSLSPEVSGVQSSCHQGKGVKISVWFKFPERRIQLEKNQKVVRLSKPPLPLENAGSPSRVTPPCGLCGVPYIAINSEIYNSNPTQEKQYSEHNTYPH